MGTCLVPSSGFAPYSGTQAWIEASTKGGVLLFTASEVETAVTKMGVNAGAAGLLGGMSGGIAQAYATMGTSGLEHLVLSLDMSCRLLHNHENC
jgi:hypothetical protein